MANAVQGGRLASAHPLMAVDVTGRGTDFAVVAVGDVRAVHDA